jgi:hypothetical protein
MFTSSKKTVELQTEIGDTRSGQWRLDTHNLTLKVVELQERIKILEEENANLNMRVELLQDLCLAE